jgi:hypothetical protein
MIFGYVEEYIPGTAEMYLVKPVPKKSLLDRLKTVAAPLLFTSMIFCNTMNLKSDGGFENNPVSKDYLAKNLGENLENIIDDNIPIKPIIEYMCGLDEGKYSDNEFYKRIRLKNAIDNIAAYKPDSDVLVIDKTFQKALLFKNHGNNYDFVNEYDCGTAKVYGRKIRPGDGKTPEGIFDIRSIEPAHDKLWDGEKAYGAYFIRILGSIGVHGNGTDTVKNPDWKTDKAYMRPDSLGVYKDNFGHGPSHGCIRLDNDVVRTLVEDGTLNTKTKVIIYENSKMTNIFRNVY